MTSRQRENQTIVIDMNRSRVAVESAGAATTIFSLFHRLFLTFIGLFIYFRRVRKQMLRHICPSGYPSVRLHKKHNIFHCADFSEILRRKSIITCLEKNLFGKIQPKLVGTVYEELCEFIPLFC